MVHHCRNLPEINLQYRHMDTVMPLLAVHGIPISISMAMHAGFEIDAMTRILALYCTALVHLDYLCSYVLHNHYLECLTFTGLLYCTYAIHIDCNVLVLVRYNLLLSRLQSRRER
jgi:hypothetical protein